LHVISAGKQGRVFMSRIARLLCRAAVGLAATSSGCLAASPVTLGYPARVSLTFAPVYAAMKLNYFAEEGIELNIVEFQGTSVLLPQVANKSVMLGFPNADPLILSRQPGRDPLPVKFFYNAARASIWEFAVPAESPIKSLDDLRGKTIGVGAIGNGNVPIIRAMLKERGLVPDRDYSFMATGDGPTAFRATLNGDVAAYNANDVFVAAFSQVAKIRKLPVPDKYRNLFSNGFVAHVDTVREHPDVLAGFGRALTKGILVCEANPDFCVLNFWRLNPSLKPGAGSDAELLPKGRQMLETRMAKYLSFPAGQPRRFGEFGGRTWGDYVDVLYQGGQLSTRDIDVSPLYTNEFVERFNAFDVKAIQDQAKALK
jgi:NitT/TauT family transport system substrate-binding protein